jgi:hypothetical protein
MEILEILSGFRAQEIDTRVMEASVDYSTSRALASTMIHISFGSATIKPQ